MGLFGGHGGSIVGNGAFWGGRGVLQWIMGFFGGHGGSIGDNGVFVGHGGSIGDNRVSGGGRRVL